MSERKSSAFNSKALVLSKESFGESDLYVVFLTEKWGIISTLAKAAKKSKRRYVGGLDLFCHDEIFIKGKPQSNPYLLELTVLNSFNGIREKLEKVFLAGRITQWVKKLAIDLPTPTSKVYSLLGQTLALIEKENDTERLELLGLLFKLKFLSTIGIKPRVESCVHCSGPVADVSAFDLAAGGVICTPCSYHAQIRSEIRTDHDERRLIMQADNIKLSSFSELVFATRKASHLTQLITQFTSYHTHIKLPF